MAQEAKNASTADVNRAYSNRRSGENKCSDGMPSKKGRICVTKPICHGCG